MGNAELVFELKILYPKWEGVETVLGTGCSPETKRRGNGVGRSSVTPTVNCWFSLLKTKQNKTRQKAAGKVDLFCSASGSFLTHLNLR